MGAAHGSGATGGGQWRGTPAVRPHVGRGARRRRGSGRPRKPGAERGGRGAAVRTRGSGEGGRGRDSGRAGPGAGQGRRRWWRQGSPSAPACSHPEPSFAAAVTRASSSVAGAACCQPSEIQALLQLQCLRDPMMRVGGAAGRGAAGVGRGVGRRVGKVCGEGPPGRSTGARGGKWGGSPGRRMEKVCTEGPWGGSTGAREVSVGRSVGPQGGRLIWLL